MNIIRSESIEFTEEEKKHFEKVTLMLEHIRDHANDPNIIEKARTLIIDLYGFLAWYCEP